MPRNYRPSTSVLYTSLMRTDNVGRCANCAATFKYSLIHNGFNESAYAYCDDCGTTAVLSGWSPNIPPEAGLRVHGRITAGVEPFLASCPCGGRFRASAVPRCPACREPLDPVACTAFIEADAPGTAKGWRWQRSWDGLYSIVINGRQVSDPWRRRPTSDVPHL